MHDPILVTALEKLESQLEAYCKEAVPTFNVKPYMTEFLTTINKLMSQQLRSARFKHPTPQKYTIYGLVEQHPQPPSPELVFTETHLFIGCEAHTWEHWVTHGQSIGKRQGYVQKEIDRIITLGLAIRDALLSS